MFADRSCTGRCMCASERVREDEYVRGEVRDQQVNL
jgi:hypothetical protein